MATAYYAQKDAQQKGLNVNITLIERDDRLGGKVTTDTSDGFVVEGGPDSFITQKPWALALARELGLEEQLVGTNDHRRKTYILRRGKLHQMPDGLTLVVPTRFWPFVKSRLISWPGKLRMGMDLFIPPKDDDEDESLADFMRRRLGHEALEVLGEPMLAGIHVAEAETLSLMATFPRLRATERKYGSLTKGMIAARKNRPPSTTSMFMTLRGGLTTLIGALEDAFDGVVLTGRGVTALGNGTVYLDDGTTLPADAVILATPAYVAADLLGPGELADLLTGIRYVDTATVSLGFDADEIGHPLNGFGFVIPHSEPTRLLACTWTSTKFDHRAPDGQVLLRVFVGGPRRQELVQLDDAELVQIVRDELRSIMGISAEPTLARVFRWSKANPQYDVGHLDRVARMEALCPPGVYLTGSAYRGVGMPDCIHQGQQTAVKAIDYLSEMVKLSMSRG